MKLPILDVFLGRSKMREKREEKTVTKDSKIFIDEKEGKRGGGR